MFLNWASVCRFKAVWVPPCQPESLARCGGPGQDRDQEEARAGDVMASAGGAAGPAPNVRHQPPGDAKQERGQNNVYIPGPRKSNTNVLTLAVQCEMYAHITGLNPAIMHIFQIVLKICIYEYIRVYTSIYT